MAHPLRITLATSTVRAKITKRKRLNDDRFEQILHSFNQRGSKMPQAIGDGSEMESSSISIPAERVVGLRVLHDRQVAESIRSLIEGQTDRLRQTLDATDWLQTERTSSEQADTYRVSTHHQQTGMPRHIYLTSYDAKTGRLIGWSVTAVNKMRNSSTETFLAEYIEGDANPLITMEVVKRDRQGLEIARNQTGSRPLLEGDPLIANPHVRGSSILARLDKAALADKLRALQAAQGADVISKFAEELRAALGIGSPPGLTDVGVPGRIDAGDQRLPSPSSYPGQDRPSGSDPLGDWDRGILDQLRQPTPRSTVVGPGSIPDESSLVGTDWVTFSQTPMGNVDRSRTTVYDPRTGAPVFIHIVDYDTSTDQLIGWSTTVVDRMGGAIVTSHIVERRGPTSEHVVVKSERVERGPHGEVIKSTPLGERERKPNVDPPMTNPNPIDRENLARSHTGEEGGSFRGVFGLECNPITGQCKFTMKLGNNQVNPGEGEQNPTGPLLNVDPQDLVVNPDPDNLPRLGQPRPIDQTGIGPGARPPDIPR